MKIVENVKNKFLAGSILVASSFMAPAAMADDATKSAIDVAVSTAKDNFTLVVVGLITLSAIGFGLARITGVMR